MIDDDDCWAIGGMRLSEETEVLGENLPQRHFVYHKSDDQTQAQTRAPAVGNQRLTAWSMGRPSSAG
jgi:hypothetical protein